MALKIPRPRLTPQMRLLMRRMAPGLVGAGVTQLNLTVDVIIASLLPAGTVSVLYFADRVQQLPLGVIGTAVGTALLPLLSRQVRAGEAASAIGTLNRATRIWPISDSASCIGTYCLRGTDHARAIRPRGIRSRERAAILAIAWRPTR